MENAIFLTIIITGLFVLTKMVEMKYIEQEMLPLKLIVRETIMVALCCFSSLYVFFEYKGKFQEWFGFNTIVDALKPPEIFTDNPGF